MIDAIITALKDRTTTFGGRFAGAAEYKNLPEAANLTAKAGYVIPLADDAGEMTSENSYCQLVRDVIAVVVVLSNATDERGQTAITGINAIRTELCKALLAWKPDSEHGPIQYEGGHLLNLNRAQLHYQFEFSAATAFSEADTWQGIANAALPALTSVEIKVDTIDPFDPNRVAAGATGPDGTIDATVLVSVPQ